VVFEDEQQTKIITQYSSQSQPRNLKRH